MNELMKNVQFSVITLQVVRLSDHYWLQTTPLSTNIIRWLENILAPERAVEIWKPITNYFQEVCAPKKPRANPSM